jgi:hypothetical protein
LPETLKRDRCCGACGASRQDLEDRNGQYLSIIRIAFLL